MNQDIPTQNIPKLVSPTLSAQRSDSFVVREGLLNNFYSIKVLPDEGRPIFRIDRSPPVIREGIAIIKKKFYHVTADDLLRGVIRKSREVTLREDRNGIPNTPVVAIIDESNPAVQRSNEPGTGDAPGLEESQLADTAFEEQVGALLDLVYSKEGLEYEITDSL